MFIGMSLCLSLLPSLHGIKKLSDRLSLLRANEGSNMSKAGRDKAKGDTDNQCCKGPDLHIRVAYLRARTSRAPCTNGANYNKYLQGK